MNQNARPSAFGFTLVELAIVMTIIGLLIGGILKGQEMVQNARITATVAQVRSYQAATDAFKDRFDQMPGDIVNATSKLPDCSASTYCYNGNGDTIIGTPQTNWSHNDQSNSTGLPAVETAMFWKHLALADLISGIAPSSTPASAVWGKTHPSSSFGGGFDILHANEGTTANAVNGLALFLKGNATGDPHSSTDSKVLTPALSAQLDRKLDDGNGLTGYVVADDNAASGSDYVCRNSTTGVYNEVLTRRVCMMLFRI